MSRRAPAIPNEDQPWIENYPPLHEWLNTHDAHWVSQDRIADGRMIEHWLINGHLAIIEVHPRKRGWNIYTALNSNNIADSLADAERRLGIAPPPTGTLCSVCDEPQVSTPSGDTCKNGHGGAPAKEQP